MRQNLELFKIHHKIHHQSQEQRVQLAHLRCLEVGFLADTQQIKDDILHSKVQSLLQHKQTLANLGCFFFVVV